MGKLNKKQKMLVLQLILLVVGVLVILYTKSGITQYLPSCTFKQCFGIICPTCGVTRCVSNMLSLNFKMAIMYHPTFFILVLYIGLLNFIYIVDTLFNKSWLRKLYPSLPMICIYFSLFIAQYAYRVYMIVNESGYEFL